MIGPVRRSHALWLDFALRMVDVHHELNEDERAELRFAVDGFICGIISDYVNPRQWDASMVYRGAVDERGYDCIGDLIRTFASELWHDPYDVHPDEMPDTELTYYTFDELRTLREEHAAFDRLADPFRACVRAGLDMACEPSGGVVGYTVGHLRSMYPEGVPSWLLDAFEVDRAAFDGAKSEQGVWL